MWGEEEEKECIRPACLFSFYKCILSLLFVYCFILGFLFVCLFCLVGWFGFLFLIKVEARMVSWSVRCLPYKCEDLNLETLGRTLKGKAWHNGRHLRARKYDSKEMR